MIGRSNGLSDALSADPRTTPGNSLPIEHQPPTWRDGLLTGYEALPQVKRHTALLRLHSNPDGRRRSAFLAGQMGGEWVEGADGWRATRRSTRAPRAGRSPIRACNASARQSAQSPQVARTIAHRGCRHLARRGWFKGENEIVFVSDSVGSDDGMEALRMSPITRHRHRTANRT